MKTTSIVPILVLLSSFATTANGGAEKLIAEGDRFWMGQELGQAEASYGHAIAESPDSARAYRQLAGVLLKRNKTRETVEAYRTAIALDPEHPRFFVAIAIAYLHERSFSASCAMCRHALQLDPELKDANSLLQYMDAKQQHENAFPGDVAPGDQGAASIDPSD